MKIAKARRTTKYPKIMKPNIRNVKNGLKQVIDASIRVLFEKGTVHQRGTYLDKTRLERCLEYSLAPVLVQLKTSVINDPENVFLGSLMP